MSKSFEYSFINFLNNHSFKHPYHQPSFNTLSFAPSASGIDLNQSLFVQCKWRLNCKRSTVHPGVVKRERWKNTISIRQQLSFRASAKPRASGTRCTRAVSECNRAQRTQNLTSTEAAAQSMCQMHPAGFKTLTACLFATGCSCSCFN